MKEKQIYNPYLPSYEYVPDGEPHVFGERVYLYGSHDRFDGAEFCLNDYVCYSADVHDLTDWKYEGVIYRKEQDPRNQNIPADAPAAKPGFCAKQERREGDLNGPGIHAMFAPDVVKGPDGRYYLYYCLDYLPEIAVAVCDTPAGRYEYLGMVRHKDDTLLGRREGDYIQFDPGIFVDDDGMIYLYSGNAPIKKEQENGTHASQVMVLSPDMLTLAGEPKKLMPSVCESEGTGYEGHEFFEASSIRKIKNKYYFVYSSVNSHELCYAVSDKPDEGYRYGGTLVDIGDIYLDGRKAEDAANCLGNTHGGMECIDGQWYIFYHRQTNRTNYSRQACAEKIYFEEDGSIRQTEVTSCGLNQRPLAGEGTYPAYICCCLRSEKGVTFSHPLAMKLDYPYLTQDAADMGPESEAAKQDANMPVQYIANIRQGSVAGYKYFDFRNLNRVGLTVRGEAQGEFLVKASLEGKILGRIPVHSQGNDWNTYTGEVKAPEGVHALYLCYQGSGCLDLIQFHLEKTLENMARQMKLHMQREQQQKIKNYHYLNQYAKKGQILFTGSSLMEMFPVCELSSACGLNKVVYNRGVGGYTTDDFLREIETVLFGLEPSKVFINIGTNDMHEREDGTDWMEHLLGNYEAILKLSKERLPQTEFYLMAYYPVNEMFAEDNPQAAAMMKVRTNGNIARVNECVSKLAESYGYHFINVNHGLTDEKGNLKAGYTIEGIHMFAEAYGIVFDNLKCYL